MEDSKVECQECKKSEQVNFARCLGAGWPKCCGYTMRLIEHPGYEEIGKATKRAISHQLPPQLR